MKNNEIEQLIKAAYAENVTEDELNGGSLEDCEDELREFLSCSDDEQRAEVDDWLAMYDMVVQDFEQELSNPNGTRMCVPENIADLNLDKIHCALEDFPLYTLRWSYDTILNLKISNYLDSQEGFYMEKIESLLLKLNENEESEGKEA